MTSIPQDVLRRIAPYVERVAGRDIPPEGLNSGPLTKDQMALRIIRREIDGLDQSPVNINDVRSILSEGRRQIRQQGHTSGLIVNNPNGGVSAITNPQEIMQAQIDFNRERIDQLMQAIQQMRASATGQGLHVNVSI